MNRQSPKGISYCDWSWSPIRGCQRVSPGCEHCYAERIAARFSGTGTVTWSKTEPFSGIAEMTPSGPRWTGEVRLIESKLDEPLRARRSAEKFRREHGRKPIVFVMDMGDLFYEKVPDEWVYRVYESMFVACWFDFLVLTKRAGRMATLFAPERPWDHIWLGVSAEDQARFDERAPPLLKLAAAGWKTWVSFEPLLEPISARWAKWDSGKDQNGSRRPVVNEHDGLRMLNLGGIAIGGESGPGARPCAVEWIEALVNQARAAGVACHVKQLGANAQDADGSMHGQYTAGGVKHGFPKLRDSHGGDPSEWPEALRVREWPEPLRGAR